MKRQHDTAREGRIEAHRLDGFIDAVFAFAVSVLAIAGAEVPHSLHDLMVALSRIPAFACSFATLMLFWHRHVQWRDRFRTHDTASIVLSLALVFFALIFVYPLDMLFSSMFNAIYAAFAHANLPEAPAITSVSQVKALYVCYGLAYACMAGCLACLYRHSIGRMQGGHAERIEAREVYYIQLGSMSVALISLAAALILPSGGAWSALPGCLYALLTAVYWITGRWSRQALARAA
jgi:uncharacterized membrane protein